MFSIKQVSICIFFVFCTIYRLTPSPPRSRKIRRSSHTTWSITGTKRSDTQLLHDRKRYNSLPRLVPKNEQDIDDTTTATTVHHNRRNGLMSKRQKNTEKYENECSEKEPFVDLPPPCTCPYFGDTPHHNNFLKPAEVRIISTSGSFRSSTTTESMSLLPTTATTTTNTTTTTSSSSANVSPSKTSVQLLPVPPPTPPARKLSYTKANSVVTWDTRRNQRRGSSLGGVRTSLLLTPNKVPASPTSPLRRSATLRNHNNMINGGDSSLMTKSGKAPSSPCLLQRTTTIRSHHSRNSSVISRNSSRHGRIIRLEQKATKVLGVVFFTFVILWAPFFVLNLLPSLCRQCEENMSPWVFDFVTWLGYASSMVNPIFYTIFNKVFRQAFKKVLCCQYSKSSKTWRPQR